MEELIGEEALVLKEINPEEKVQINGEFRAATTRGPAIPKGKIARIVEAEGLVLTLEDLEDKANSPRQGKKIFRNNSQRDCDYIIRMSYLCHPRPSIRESNTR